MRIELNASGDRQTKLQTGMARAKWGHMKGCMHGDTFSPLTSSDNMNHSVAHSTAGAVAADWKHEHVAGP